MKDTGDNGKNDGVGLASLFPFDIGPLSCPKGPSAVCQVCEMEGAMEGSVLSLGRFTPQRKDRVACIRPSFLDSVLRTQYSPLWLPAA